MQFSRPTSKLSVLAIIVLSLGTPIFAATVTSAVCSTSVEIGQGNYVSVNNSGGIPDNCGGPGNFGDSALASASASAEIGGFPGQPPYPYDADVPSVSTVYGSISASADSSGGSEACNYYVGCFASASMYASETITFQTLGPIRPGIAILYTYGLPFEAGDDARASDGAGGVESSSPVELGTTLSISGSASASTNGTDGEEAGASEYFWLVIYEADGVTPVPVQDATAAPEPSTWASSLLPLAWCALRSLRRKPSAKACALTW